MVSSPGLQILVSKFAIRILFLPLVSRGGTIEDTAAMFMGLHPSPVCYGTRPK